MAKPVDLYLKLQLEASTRTLRKAAEVFRNQPKAALTREEVADTLEMLATEITRAGGHA